MERERESGREKERDTATKTKRQRATEREREERHRGGLERQGRAGSVTREVAAGAENSYPGGVGAQGLHFHSCSGELGFRV